MTKHVEFHVPVDIDFSELKLHRDASGIRFEYAPLRRLCEINGLDPDDILRHEDNIASMVTAWYFGHRSHGGDIDPVAEDIIAEALIEGQLQGGVSHSPGNA